MAEIASWLEARRLIASWLEARRSIADDNVRQGTSRSPDRSKNMLERYARVSALLLTWSDDYEADLDLSSEVSRLEFSFPLSSTSKPNTLFQAFSQNCEAYWTISGSSSRLSDPRYDSMVFNTDLSVRLPCRSMDHHCPSPDHRPRSADVGTPLDVPVLLDCDLGNQPGQDTLLL